MDDDYTPDVPDGLIDHEAIYEILEKVQDAIRPLGLSFDPRQAQLMVQQGQVMAVLPCIVRPSAKKKLTEDKKSREDFNKMMARNHEAMIESEAERVRKALERARETGDLSALFEDSVCEHKRRHPTEGFCLDCGEGLNHGD